MKVAVQLVWFTCGLLALSASQAAGLKKHRFDAEVHVGNVGLGEAKFELACSAGKGGSLSLSLVLMHRDAAKAFALDEFEGPDGIGESRPLAQWGVDTRGPATNLDSNISGWYGVDGDGFVLSTAAMRGKSTALPDFVRQLTSSEALRLRLRVTPPHGGDPLQASAALSGAQADLSRVAADCLAPK
jgi:hypothetical protein